MHSSCSSNTALNSKAMSAAQPQSQQHANKGVPMSALSISTKPFEIDSIIDYMAPYLPPQQAALASLSLSASLLHCPSPAHLLASSYLLQRKRHYTTAAFAQLLTSLAHSTTLYIGNLSFTTREEQLLSTLSLPTLHYPATLHMGLNSLTKQPCGFAFLAFSTSQQAHTTRAVMHGLQVDERTVGVDLDQRFKAGREWGRGKSGGQIRDEVRQGWDKGRGGWGARERRQQQMREMKEQQKSTFKRMGEGEEQQEQREADAEEEEAVQQQRAKREHGSYADAQAKRRAGVQHVIAVEAEADDEQANTTNKRQRLEDTDQHGKLSHEDGDAQSTAADGDDGGRGGVYWAEEGGVEEGGMTEERERMEVGLDRSDGRQEEQQAEVEAEEEETEPEHGFAGAEEDNDEPQWT